jgi:hypothetical protein
LRQHLRRRARPSATPRPRPASRLAPFLASGAKALTPCCDPCTAQVGTSFDVLFVVFDDSVPARSATAVRTVTLVAPCEPGHRWCPEERLCSALPCDQRAMLLPVTLRDTTAPTITFPKLDRSLSEGAARQMVVVYGVSQPQLDLMPCSTAPVNKSASAAEPSASEEEGWQEEAACWAYAWDDVDGDVSRFITVEQNRVDCPGCPACPLESVATAACFPGEYTYVYYVADATGNVATDYMVVKVVQQGALRTQLRVAGGRDAAVAAELAARLADGSGGGSAENGALRAGVATALNAQTVNSVGEEVTAADVVVEEATVDWASFDPTAAASDSDSNRRRRRRRRRRLQETGVGSDGSDGGDGDSDGSDAHELCPCACHGGGSSDSEGGGGGGGDHELAAAASDDSDTLHLERLCWCACDPGSNHDSDSDGSGEAEQTIPPMEDVLDIEDGYTIVVTLRVACSVATSAATAAATPTVAPSPTFVPTSAPTAPLAATAAPTTFSPSTSPSATPTSAPTTAHPNTTSTPTPASTSAVEADPDTTVSRSPRLQRLLLQSTASASVVAERTADLASALATAAASGELATAVGEAARQVGVAVTAAAREVLTVEQTPQTTLPVDATGAVRAAAEAELTTARRRYVTMAAVLQRLELGDDGLGDASWYRCDLACAVAMLFFYCRALVSAYFSSAGVDRVADRKMLPCWCPRCRDLHPGCPSETPPPGQR